MKKLFLLGGLAAILAATTTTTMSCRDTDDDPKPDTTTTSTDRGTDAPDYTTANLSRTTNNNSTYVEPSNNELSSDITYNTVLKTGKTYTLKNFVYVRWGATLKIEPGVTIKGDKGTKSTLIITRNGKIDAQGTASQPIVFTSGESSPNRGDWGGIILLGNARNNSTYQGTAGIAQIEGGVNNTAGYGIHGGTKDDDNSGTMKYVRIEYPGVAFQPDNEINGLTMGSVGSGTTIDYVEVYRSGDDSYEWFGGTVNCKHLIAVEGTDDDFDTDFGYSGKVQFGIALRDPAQADFAANGTSNGFESDNDGNGSTSTPRTAAVFSNMTMVGPRANGTPVSQFGRGAHIRRNSAQSIFNSAFIGWATGIRIDGNATTSAFLGGTAEFKNNFVANASRVADTAGTLTGANIFAPVDFFNTTGGNTSDIAGTTGFLANQTLGSSFNAGPTSSQLTSGASFTNSSKLSSGFEVVSYRGAIGSTNWTTGWTKF